MNSTDKTIALKSVKKRKDPNDKVNKRFFDMTDKQHARGELIINESRKGSKNIIKTPIHLEYTRYTEEIMATRPRFNAFDRELLYACISEQIGGNMATTINSIYRLITGDSGMRKPSPQMAELINQSLCKLMFCDVKIDLTEVCLKYGYNKGQPCVFEGAILPGYFVRDAIVNGEKADVVKFYEKSPLFLAAEIKNQQILTYEKNLLDVPIRNSPEVIVMKNYILRRIQEIIIHHLTPTITFDDVFTKNQITDLTPTQKMRYRDYICKMFDFWIEKKLISKYVVNKEQHIPISISFAYKKNKKVLSLEEKNPV